jgi:ABC-type branched-subunit amino acid transport system substrate-binding protein
MKLTDLGREVRKRHKAKTGREPSRVVFQGFDAVWFAAKAVEKAGSIEPSAVIKAMKEIEVLGTRGSIRMNLKKGPFFQQWVKVPYCIIQFTQVKQPLAQAPIVFPEDQKTAELLRP